MDTDGIGDISLTNEFEHLQLSDTDRSLGNASLDRSTPGELLLPPLVPLQAQQEDPCKWPQSAPNDNSSDDASASGSDSVIVVDSDESPVASFIDPCIQSAAHSSGASSSSGDIIVDSDVSSVVSFIDPDCMLTYCASSSGDNDHVLGVTIEETESEAADEHGSGNASDSAPSSTGMDTPSSSLSKSASKRSSSYSLSDDDTQSKKCKLDAIRGAGVESPGRNETGLKRSSPFPAAEDIPIKKIMEGISLSTSSPGVVTRSGRTVRVRLDTKFDYSSSQPDEDSEHGSEELSDSDDAEYKLRDQEPKWSSRKRRRSSHGSNRTSSSIQLEPALIYLDLGSPVATIMPEPQAGLALDDDECLKTQVLKFLDLIPRRRKLFNPELQLDPDEPDEPEAASQSFLFASPATRDAPVEERPEDLLPPLPEPALLASSCLPVPLTVADRKTRMMDETLLLLGASNLDLETPPHIKTPIDLTELPGEKERARNCRWHKSCIACLAEHPCLYRFVDSLNPRTSIRMCHPQALFYRKSSFESCKHALAKLLFNLFNHAVFHCALQADLVWKRGMGTYGLAELIIDSGGQRSGRILLSENMTRASMLVKPLLHEMCHLAAFVFNRETGHGETCRKWAFQANRRLMDTPRIDVCNARYSYVCSMCGRGSYGLTEFAVGREMLRCHYCQFEVIVEPWSADDIDTGIRPDTTMTEFKTFVFDRYQQLGAEAGGSHSSKMCFLNNQYLAMKMQAACD